jgi:hypothetical protein
MYNIYHFVFNISVTGCSCVQLSWMETRGYPSHTSMHFFIPSKTRYFVGFLLLTIVSLQKLCLVNNATAMNLLKFRMKLNVPIIYRL